MCFFSSPSMPKPPSPPPGPPPPPEDTAQRAADPGRGLARREGRASRIRRRGVKSLKIQLDNVGGGTGTGGAY